MSAQWHGYMVIKALIVGTSWICAYFALKHLPISIVSPIRASGPVWTLVGAIVLFHEQPAPLQWGGMGIIFVCYFAFSLLGREEGIHFHRSKWVGLIFIATLIGTSSTLFDKWLIQLQGMAPVDPPDWNFSGHRRLCLFYRGRRSRCADCDYVGASPLQCTGFILHRGRAL
ncbi:MAG: EamA family transporter [Pontiella sp.]